MHEFLTPIFRFPDDSEFRNIFLKREDLSETGSHKFRYLKKQMEELKKNGVNQVVLSTTGNVGITASHYGKSLGIRVFCIMSEEGEMDKAAQIEKEGGFLVVSTRPKRFSEYLSKKYQVPLLRGSRDVSALEGYAQLGKELVQQVPEAKALVNFSSSGVSTIGLARAYEGRALPAFHVACTEKEKIVLGDELQTLVTSTHGTYWTLSESEMTESRKILNQFGVETSWEGECSFAAALKIKDLYPSILVILSGKKWPEVNFASSKKANSLEEIDQLWREFNQN